MNRTPIPLDADLEAGLKRLKLSTIRRQAPDVLATAKAQRWAPEDVLRSLVEAEISDCDELNARNDGTDDGDPDVGRFNISGLLSGTRLPGGRVGSTKRHLCLVGPAGTGKSHYLIGLAGPPSPPATRSATSGKGEEV